MPCSFLAFSSSHRIALTVGGSMLLLSDGLMSESGVYRCLCGPWLAH